MTRRREIDLVCPFETFRWRKTYGPKSPSAVPCWRAVRCMPSSSESQRSEITKVDVSVAGGVSDGQSEAPLDATAI
jgi:hypothetical protein